MFEADQTVQPVTPDQSATMVEADQTPSQHESVSPRPLTDPVPAVHSVPHEAADVSSETSLDSRIDTESIIEPKNCLKGKFLSTYGLLDILNSATEIFSETPWTVKENVYFVLDHSSNISKQSSNTRMDRWDNCGVWDTKSTSLKTTFFEKQENGTLKSCVRKKDGLFL